MQVDKKRMRETESRAKKEKSRKSKKVKIPETMNECWARKKTDNDRKMKEETKRKQQRHKELEKWAAATKILIHSTERALAFKALGLPLNQR